MATSKQNILKKLSSKLKGPEGHAMMPQPLAKQLDVVLEEHLDSISAAHQSNHGSVHQSLPIV